jgi:hypothetical protein
MIDISCSSLKNKTSQNKIHFTRISTYSGNSSWNVLVSFWPNIFFYIFFNSCFFFNFIFKNLVYCLLWFTSFFFYSYSSLMIHVIGSKSWLDFFFQLTFFLHFHNSTFVDYELSFVIFLSFFLQTYLSLMTKVRGFTS